MRTIGALLLLAVSASYGVAQDPDPAPAPIPSQIIAGKKAFISNASGESAVPMGMPELTYNEFYAAMKSWGRYELVSAPADADIVLEIRFVVFIGEANVMSGSSLPSRSHQLRVTILDPKSHTVLWAFTEPIRAAARQSTERKNLDQAMGNLVNDVRNLAGQPATAGGSAKN